MLIPDLKQLFMRDLHKLEQEIAAYRDEASIWMLEGSIKNTGGNLCLHLLGNLNAYIGVGLAQTDYIRNREQEFSLKNISREVLLQQTRETAAVVGGALDRLSENALQETFPLLIWDKPTGMAYTLMHLYGHLNYHLGQINYHRRMLEK